MDHPTPKQACGICGGTTFGPGPAGRMSPTGRPPHCVACGSLERHRALRALMDTIPPAELKWRRGLQFSPDPAIEPQSFVSYEVSVYGQKSSLDLQKIARPDGSYDFVTLNHVIEFVPDARASFSELTRILSGNGLLEIGFSNLDSRPVTLDYETPQSLHGYFHLFGRDFENYLELERHGVSVVPLSQSDPVTDSTDTFHFFCRDKATLDRLAAYQRLAKLPRGK